MSTRQINIPDFCAHAAEELNAVEHGQAVVALTRDGQIVAWLSPAAKVAVNAEEWQKTPIVHFPECLLGTGTEEEWAGFDEALTGWRSEQTLKSVTGDDASYAARH